MQNQRWVNQQVERLSSKFLELNIDFPAAPLLLSAVKSAPVKGKLNLTFQQVIFHLRPNATTTQSTKDKLAQIKRSYALCAFKVILEQIYHLRKIGYLLDISNFPCLVDGF